MKSSKLTIAIIISLILGVFVGWAFPDVAIKMHVLAEIFLRMVKMIIGPLLFATLVVGIAGHADIKSLGRLGIKTIVYFEVITTIALIMGLGFANLFQPGKCVIDSETVKELTREVTNTVTTTQNIDCSFGNMMLEMFPTSIFQSMAENDLLQIVIFSIFFAYNTVNPVRSP